MKFIEINRKSHNGFFDEVTAGVKDIIDDSKEKYLFDFFSRGLSNRILFEKFAGYHWPLWLESAINSSTASHRTYPNPLLLNTSFREWQVFTNYLSRNGITVDRSGMISGPSESEWSLEFWIHYGGKLHRPQSDRQGITITRNTKTGEIVSVWSVGGLVVTERIAGSRSSVDEALVSVEINARKAEPDSFLIAALRPYNNCTIGGLKSVQIDPESGIIFINGKGLAGFDTIPDQIVTGSGSSGDIPGRLHVDEAAVQCSYGMATAGLKYIIETGKRSFNFRISLNGESSLPAAKINYSNLFREFALFSEMRLAEGIKAELTDTDFSSLFLQSRLSILNINYGDIAGGEVESFRKLFFSVYALCRTGATDAAEVFFKAKLDEFTFNRKKPDLEDVIKGCFLIKSCYEIFIHKRDTGFLQAYYPAVKGIAEFVYRFSVDLHSAAGRKKNTGLNFLSSKSSITDTVYIFSAVSVHSYLARCMGIFGDESKFKNESLRLQSLMSDLPGREGLPAQDFAGAVFSLLSLPEKILVAIKNDDYSEILGAFLSDSGYPLVHPLYGIDMFSSAVLLNHLYAAGVNSANSFYIRLAALFDSFYTTPEYIDPSSKRGAWGEGNSIIVNSVMFALMRNRLFVDNQDRLELFPVPDPSWFKSGSRIKVENATSRFGIISFTLEIIENELRINFGGSPKYLPPDILINIPYNTSIIPGDDFIVKKKTGYNYIINGWPASVRFTVSS